MTAQLDVSDKTFEKIRNYYLKGDEKVPLTEHEEEIRKRWDMAFCLMLDGKYVSDKNIIPFLKEKFEISDAQAYRDISSAKRLFGDMRRSSREAMRYLVTELAKQVFQRASSTDDFDNMNKALGQIIKANNLDREDLDLPDPSKIQPPIQILQLNIDFITSKYADVIDERAKEKINKLLSEIKNIVEKNRINDYLDNNNKMIIPTIDIKDGD
jgi:hypothetical protein